MDRLDDRTATHRAGARAMTGLTSDMPQRTGSLLVVDDDETILRMMVDFLDDNGHSVLSAASRAEMRRHLTHAQVSLVILDVADMSAAQDWAANDPYAKAGLFESVELVAWKKVIG